MPGCLQLTCEQKATLQYVYNNATIWARSWAKNIILDYAPELLIADPDALVPSSFTIVDTILFPPLPDSVSIDTSNWQRMSHGSSITNNNGGIRVFPNPVHDGLQVECAAAGTLTISDMAGRQVAIITLTSGNNQINVSQLTPGMYLYKINTDGGTIAKGKISKY